MGLASCQKPMNQVVLDSDDSDDEESAQPHKKVLSMDMISQITDASIILQIVERYNGLFQNAQCFTSGTHQI